MSRPLSAKHRERKKVFDRNLLRPQVETLEDRVTPSGNTISGYVYYDANNNGVFDPGETPIANSQIQLFNTSNQLVGTTTTNAQGYYQFTTDYSAPTLDETLTKTVTFPSTETDFNLSGVLDQFDPSLGQLQSVEIQHAGSITSEIKVENLSQVSASNISGNVSGTLTLTAPGVNNNLAINGSAGSFHAGIYDGTLDFGGTSGTSFGQRTANGSNTITLTGSDITPYIGTGTVNVNEAAVATSSATGGGNLDVLVNSTATSTITVIYHYLGYGPLQPGNYKIVQPQEPAGYIDGQESQNGVVIPNTIGSDFINVTLNNTDSTNNDFGELKSTSISGHVYFDANNNGQRDSSDTAITGVTMTLNGPGGLQQTTTTDANGFYQFNNLTPGVYTVSETQPAGYINGTDTPGTDGGTVFIDATHEQITNITLNSGDNAQNYDFGELHPPVLSGHVYFDANDNGQRDTGDSPISGVTITLTGPGGQQTATTDANGFYQFNNLTPGTYSVAETEPANYLNGTTTAGTKGGTVVMGTSKNQIGSIPLVANDNSQNNDFGALLPSSLAGKVYIDNNNNGQLDTGEPPIPGTKITLTGFADNGPVSLTTTTASDGSYSFTNLRPGTYAITETQPAGYNEGQTTVGSQGGTGATDVISNINLPAGVNGVNNNFGEVKPSVPNNPLPKQNNLLDLSLPGISKSQMETGYSSVGIPAQLRADLAFFMGTSFTLLGVAPTPMQTLQGALALENGSLSRAGLVTQLSNSVAHQTLQVNTLYQSLLSRAPTSQELADGISTLKNSGQIALQQSILVSTSYQQLHPTSNDLVTALYQDVLNEVPGTADTQSLLQSMGTQPLSDVVSGLLNSNASLGNLVDATYRTVLRRPATSAEIQTWTTQLQANTITLDQLEQRLLTSQEFYQLTFNSIK
jgi:protocatechuate 3,4-dioxygenase beta subunit